MISGVLTKERLQTVIGVGFFEFRSLFYRLDVAEVVVRIRQVPDAQVARCDSRIRQAAHNPGRFGARAERVSALAPNTIKLSLLNSSNT